MSVHIHSSQRVLNGRATYKFVYPDAREGGPELKGAACGKTSTCLALPKIKLCRRDKLCP